MLRVEGFKKVFRSGERDLVLFENLSFHVSKGEMLAIVGNPAPVKVVCFTSSERLIALRQVTYTAPNHR